MEFQNNKKYIVIRDDTIACFDVKKGVTEKSLVNVRDINMWIATKTIHGISIKNSVVIKLKRLRKKMIKDFTNQKQKTEKPTPVKRKKKELTIEKMKIEIVKSQTLLYININDSIFLTPSEFANLTYHVINNVQLESLKYKTGKQYITPSSAKKKIQIDLGLIKKIYTELINSGIKIPLYLKSKIDNIYRWQ